MNRVRAALSAAKSSLLCAAAFWLVSLESTAHCLAQAPPVRSERLFTTPEYCEGIVFDHSGNGYVSHGKSITKFTPDGRREIWAETGGPNGHKVLADGTHLVCDLSQRAVLHLDADGRPLKPASTECDGKPLRGPNDLSLDVANGGFYFTDPEGSGSSNPIGTIHYVDRDGRTRRFEGGLAYPNGIALRPDGQALFVSESGKNRILAYDVVGPGRIDGQRVFAELPAKNVDRGQINNLPDGLCLDAEGNMYVAHYGMQQVQVLNPEGKLIRQLDGGNLTTSNVAFGGPKMAQLFVTGAIESGPGAVFRIETGVRGLVILPPRQ